MSNSALVNYVNLSPNHSGRRTQKISKIAIHHMAGNLSVEACGNLFANPHREVSANYGIGSDGRIAMYVEECNRSWCTASNWNDQRAVTIEVANDGGAPNWHVSDKAMASLINLCVDICKRNNFRLSYDGTKNGSLTRHNMFTATTCPGPYLQSKFEYIANEVNARLNNATPTPQKPVHSGNYKLGDKVRFSTCYKASTDTSDKAIQAKNMSRNTGTITKIVNARNPYLLDNGLCWVNNGDIRELISSTPATQPKPPAKPSKPKPQHLKGTVICDALNMRQSPVNGKVLRVLRNGEYFTILSAKDGWFYIDFAGTRGYVAVDDNYVRVEDLNNGNKVIKYGTPITKK